MNRKIFRRLGLMILALTILSGCGRVTHVTREDQLAHVTNPPSTGIATEQTADSTAVPENTTSAATDTPDSEEVTAAPQTEPATGKATEPASTKATRPPETTGPEKATETTVPETTEATQPETEPTEGSKEPDPYDISGYVCGSLEYAILDAVNASRQAEGLPELTLGHRLSAISSVRAYESSVSFSHTRPDGRNCFSVLSDYGYGYSCTGENLLQCSGGYSAADMVELWMGSSGHRANILQPDVTTLGVGVYRSGGMIYVATIFTD